MIFNAVVDGHQVSIGDYVSFKQDVEQTGYIVRIDKNMLGNITLTLRNDRGFAGDYIGGEMECFQLARDCWID